MICACCITRNGHPTAYPSFARRLGTVPFLLPHSRVRVQDTPRKLSTRRFASSSNAKKVVQDVSVERDVRYSSYHPRNVLDIYTPMKNQNVTPILLFVHGGMWLRGSKEQKPLSLYEVASHVTNKALGAKVDEEELYSNVGVTIAQHGGVTCVMNYRLAAATGGEGHPHQVMDVARAIVFLMKWSSSEGKPLHLYVGGHSAGAHLAALVLCDSQYLRQAMQEEGLDCNELEKVVKGFIGISGVYNLRRLAMSPLAEITIGPAFGGGELDDEDATLEASPLHALLAAHSGMKKTECDASVPLLARIPALLLNAESDFHLRQDTLELFTALGQFSHVSSRESAVIPSRNHLSIMSEFGQGPPIDGHDDVPEGDSWTLANVYRQSRAAFSTYVTPYFLDDTVAPPDETSVRVLDFMRLK